ncbi:unnamed protein product [Closterium sp. Naga37s-1]|nr:unnamed protein product [Closterium sp. Naga37s-1]
MLRRTQLSALEKAPTTGLDPEMVQALPTVTFSREKLREGCCESFRECAVCLGEYEEGECIKTLPSCGHRFHATCIDIWLCAHDTTCPICRFNLKPPKLPDHCWQQEDSQGPATDAGDSGDGDERHATASDEGDPSAIVNETTADSVSIQVENVDNSQQEDEFVVVGATAAIDASPRALAPSPEVRAAAVVVTEEADASSAAAAVASAGTETSRVPAGVLVPAVVESSAIPAAAVVSQRRRTGEADRSRLQRLEGQEDEERQEVQQNLQEMSGPWAEIALTEEEDRRLGDSRGGEELRRFLRVADEVEDSGLKEGRVDWELGLEGGECSKGDKLSGMH